VLEINKRILRPQAPAEVLTCDELSGTFYQDGQDFDGLAVQVQLLAELEEFAGLRIEFKGPEANSVASEDTHRTPSRTAEASAERGGCQ